jgi:hypothetical protein
MPPSIQVLAFSGARSAGEGCTEDAEGVMLGVCAFSAVAVDAVGTEEATPNGVYGRFRWQPLQPAVEPRNAAAMAPAIASDSARVPRAARLFGRAHRGALVNISRGSNRRLTMASADWYLGVLGAGSPSKFLRLVPRPRLVPLERARPNESGE